MPETRNTKQESERAAKILLQMRSTPPKNPKQVGTSTVNGGRRKTRKTRKTKRTFHRRKSRRVKSHRKRR